LVWSAESIREAGHIPNFFMFFAYGLIWGVVWHIHIYMISIAGNADILDTMICCNSPISIATSCRLINTLKTFPDSLCVLLTTYAKLMIDVYMFTSEISSEMTVAVVEYMANLRHTTA
jgi:hypothetical protein